ncbi:glycosyltransferase [Aromatoleum toluvorans]|uniref:Glycosyltransferase n=1 Tax=Aromatoleum toluvorans TaxID=92002 RepID=A0ABX1PV67_9RHOO|nr:glycosyltransferase [Aromatoleum toluvorans]NMG43322.1 glycosyltransferase [Aromatoleum toluvorans]
MTIPSLHIIGSREMGGAERWFVRFLRAMQRAGLPVQALVRSGGDLATRHLAGIPTHELPMRTVWDPLSRWQVSAYARAARTPIVQTYMGRASRLTHLKPGRGQIHVARLGGYYALHPFRHAHAWIGNTKGLCDWMIRHGLPAERVHHITNFADAPIPVDTAKVAALRAQIGARDDDWLLLHPGRFVKVKGHATLLAAFARLPAEIAGRRPRLILMGDGPLREALETQAREFGIMDRIVWAGWQHEPAQWFHLADAVVFPSRDEETLGNVVLEAWAYRKPLVATAFRGAREIARHGEDSWIVPCDDPAALAAGIEGLLADAALQTAFVAQGVRRVTDDFGEAAILARYQALYARLAGG